MKKKVLFLALASVMCFTAVASACGGGGGKEQGDPTKANLYIATWDGGVGDQWLKNAAAEFEAKYATATHFQEGRTGVKIHVDASRRYDGTTLADGVLNKDIYFVEGVNYYRLINSGQVTDLTDVMTTPLTEYGDSKTIESKLDVNYKAFLSAGGKYYGIPFYDGFYGLVYDVTLWEEEGFYFAKDTSAGTFTKDKNNLSDGPDGVAGTLDDGMPATYEEFYKLMTDKLGKGSTTPFVVSTRGQEYPANFLYNYWAANEGEEFLLNLTFDGTATNLIDVDANGNATRLDATEITFDNGYMLQKQAGKYQALKFMEDVLCFSENNYEIVTEHTDAQEIFVSSGIKRNEPYAMIIEGSWWENEAKIYGGFDGIDEDERHDYAIMPIPRPLQEDVGGVQTCLSLSSSYGVVAKNCGNMELAKEFMKFLHTDEQLSAFTAETSMTRALNYEVKESDLEKVTYYGKSLIDMKKTANVIYPYSALEEVINHDELFTAFTWAWQSNVDGEPFKNPWLYMKDVKDASAEAYFNGLYKNFESKWSIF